MKFGKSKIDKFENIDKIIKVISNINNINLKHPACVLIVI